MNSNFGFLSERFPELSKFGKQAENYIYSDPISSLIKQRMIEETMVNMILEFDSIRVPFGADASSKINELYRQDLITSDLRDILHAVRKAGNVAIHDNKGDVKKAKTLIEMTYSLSEWFYQTYGDWEYEHQDFIMPSEEIVSENLVTIDNAEDERLVEEAVKAAAAAPKISKEERKKQSYKAANQRPKTEKETRYLIDEQLRKVGWEADTDNLRHSKGTRPQKGRNMAIAEWPTDSTVGDRGFADYALFVGLKMIGVIEAKAIHKDIPSVIDNQCRDYARNIRKQDEEYIDVFYGESKVPFTFATNGRPYLK